MGVLTASRLLRSPITAIEVPRYVSGWALKIVQKLLRGPARYVSGWELRVVLEATARAELGN